MNHLKKLESIIKYEFRNKEYLETAIRHSSYVNEHRQKRLNCNERLEFLGDAVLELVSSEHLFRLFPEMPEGDILA